MKFPPSWQTLRWINLGTATLCIGLGLTGGPTWLGMVNMGLGGFLIGMSVWIGRHMKMHELFNEQAGVLQTMMELNEQLIAGRVQMMMEGRNAGNDAENKLTLH